MDDGYISTQHEHNKRGESDAFNILARKRAKLFASSVGGAQNKGNVRSVLDAGCREGIALEVLNLYLPGRRLVGVDIVPAFVQEASKRTKEVYEADIHDLSRFRDDEFDWVFTSHTLEHCYDPPKAFGELSRVAAKGMFIVVPLEGEASFAKNPSHFYHTKDPMDWLTMFRSPKWILNTAHISDYSDMVCVLLHPSTIQYGGVEE